MSPRLLYKATAAERRARPSPAVPHAAQQDVRGARFLRSARTMTFSLRGGFHFRQLPVGTVECGL